MGLRKAWLLVLFLGLTWSCFVTTEAYAAEPISKECQAIFQPLDDALKIHGFGINNKTKAKIFETIYNEHSQDPKFIDYLGEYLSDDVEKHYWIGIYLYDDYYTKIFNWDLAFQVLEKGLNISENGSDQTRFNFEIGVFLWTQGKKEEARPYFEKWHILSKDHPGCTPAIDQETRDAIDSFMGFE